MADSKYGILFTTQDLSNVLAVLGITDTPGINEAIRRVQSSVGLTFPTDEPLFVIRGQDQAAPAAISAYREAAEFNGAGQELLDGVTRAAIEVVGWQSKPETKVKVPD